MQEYWRKPVAKLIRKNFRYLSSSEGSNPIYFVASGSLAHTRVGKPRSEDKTMEAFHVDEHGELWFRTGDIGAVDEDDFVLLAFGVGLCSIRPRFPN